MMITTKFRPDESLFSLSVLFINEKSLKIEKVKEIHLTKIKSWVKCIVFLFVCVVFVTFDLLVGGKSVTWQSNVCIIKCNPASHECYGNSVCPINSNRAVLSHIKCHNEMRALWSLSLFTADKVKSWSQKKKVKRTKSKSWHGKVIKMQKATES